MTEQSIFEKLVQHHEETGEVMKPTRFATLFCDVDPQVLVQAIYRFDEYLEKQRAAG